MNIAKNKFFELLSEFIIYLLMSLIHYVLTTENNTSFDDAYVIAGLWLAICVYRLIFLQLPIAWLVSHFLIEGDNFIARLKLGGVNFVTFIVVISFSSLLSPIVASFLEPDRIFIPVTVLIATTLSPIAVFIIKVGLKKRELI